MTFEKWYEAVNAEFIAIVGMDVDSWPDQCYWDMWSAGDSPREAVIAAIENEYGEEGLEAFGLEDE